MVTRGLVLLMLLPVLLSAGAQLHIQKFKDESGKWQQSELSLSFFLNQSLLILDGIEGEPSFGCSLTEGSVPKEGEEGQKFVLTGRIMSQLSGISISAFVTGKESKQIVHSISVNGKVVHPLSLVQDILLSLTVFLFSQEVPHWMGGQLTIKQAALLAYDSGASKYEKGQYSKAVPYFKRAIKTDPVFFHAWQALALTYCKEEKYGLSFSALKKSLSLIPDRQATNSLLFWAARLARASGHYEESYAYFNRVRQKKGETTFSPVVTITQPGKGEEVGNLSAQEHYEKALSYALMKDHAQAYLHLEQALSLNPAFPQAYYTRGLLEAKDKESQEALKDFSRAIQLKSDYAEAYSARGILYAQSKFYLQAIQDFTTAIHLNPKDAESLHHRGLMWNKLGSLKKALKDIKAAAGLGYKPSQQLLQSYYLRSQ